MFPTDFKTLPQALASYGSRFHGLGMGSAYLSHLLLLRANVTTGMIEGLSYRDLTHMMAIDHAPGRQNAGIPKITRVRSYAQSIALALPDDFEIISEGQLLKLRFKTLPAFIQNFFAQKQDSRGTDGQYGNAQAFEKSAQKPLFSLHSQASFSAEASRAEDSNNIVNYNRTKLTNSSVAQKSLKQPIALDFFPSQTTITQAQSLGFEKVLDLNEIQAFIDYNHKIGSKWEDFNPIYLNWLQRDAERTQQQQAREAFKAERTQQKQQINTGSEIHAARKPSKTRTKSYDELVAEIAANYQRALDAEACERAAYGIPNEPQDFNAAFDAELDACFAVGAIDTDIRQPFYAKARHTAFESLAGCFG